MHSSPRVQGVLNIGCKSFLATPFNVLVATDGASRDVGAAAIQSFIWKAASQVARCGERRCGSNVIPGSVRNSTLLIDCSSYYRGAQQVLLCKSSQYGYSMHYFSCLCKWNSRVGEGQESLEDDNYSGRPSKSRTAPFLCSSAVTASVSWNF